ncbi:MAG: ATP synthase F1 subunit epsilon [Actinobacteria bacterium]|nr:MAG: ATP synthase F1 subunit epsilon [Actinomycetota bacterium]
MARTLMCEIITPERIVYTNEVDMVIAPTIDGEIGILPLHAPLVSALRAGEVRVKFGGEQTEWFAVAGGYVQVHEDKVILLADAAVASSQIDIERVRQSMEHAQARMSEVAMDDEALRTEVERELKWCEAQIAVGGRKR